MWELLSKTTEIRSQRGVKLKATITLPTSTLKTYVAAKIIHHVFIQKGWLAVTGMDRLRIPNVFDVEITIRHAFILKICLAVIITLHVGIPKIWHAVNDMEWQNFLTAR